MIVVEREDPAHPLDPVVGLRAHGDRPARPLTRVHELVLERTRQRAVEERARRVVGATRRHRERVRTTRDELGLDHLNDASTLTGVGSRQTWDALAARPDTYVGDPERGREELAGLFGRLGADPRGGVCIEVGCGPGRMTTALAERFHPALARDGSPP